MFRKYLVITAAVLMLAAAGPVLYGLFARGPVSDAASFSYSCDGNNGFDVVFYISDKPMADVTLSDGRHYLLSQGLSASGARYVNPDESFVLWIKGDTAFIEENGIRTFDGCALKK